MEKYDASGSNVEPGSIRSIEYYLISFYFFKFNK